MFKNVRTQDNYPTFLDIMFNQILSPCALPEINTFYQNNEKSGTKRSEQMNWQCGRDISEQKLSINGLYPRLLTPHNNWELLCKTFLIPRSKKMGFRIYPSSGKICRKIYKIKLVERSFERQKRPLTINTSTKQNDCQNQIY